MPHPVTLSRSGVAAKRPRRRGLDSAYLISER
jgi:hypothetical protein